MECRDLPLCAPPDKQRERGKKFWRTTDRLDVFGLLKSDCDHGYWPENLGKLIASLGESVPNLESMFASRSCAAVEGVTDIIEIRTM
jgi:hypothetical protein